MAGRINLGTIASQVGDDPGEPGIDNQPNAFLTSYRGNISTPDDRFRIEGTPAGRFLGTRVNNPDTDVPMKGLVAGDDNGFSLDSDGDDAPVILGIIAENTDG